MEAVVNHQHSQEVLAGERFEFGKNWLAFLKHVNDFHVQEAENSLRTMLQRDSLQNLSFLDMGSGSGLFSLAARRLGARVHSVDYDPRSVGLHDSKARALFSGGRTGRQTTRTGLGGRDAGVSRTIPVPSP